MVKRNVRSNVSDASTLFSNSRTLYEFTLLLKKKYFVLYFLKHLQCIVTLPWYPQLLKSFAVAASGLAALTDTDWSTTRVVWTSWLGRHYPLAVTATCDPPCFYPLVRCYCSRALVNPEPLAQTLDGGLEREDATVFGDDEPIAGRFPWSPILVRSCSFRLIGRPSCSHIRRDRWLQLLRADRYPLDVGQILYLSLVSQYT